MGISTKKDDEIEHLLDDSRKVKKHDIYVCTLKTERAMDYIQEALQKDAIVYGCFAYHHPHYYQYQDEAQLHVLLETFYQFDLSKMIIIGICGSNGKTSTAKMIYENVKAEAMLISTHHLYCKENHLEIKNTTPNAFELAQYVQYAFQQKCKYLIMEVSSHAIDQKRMFFLRYDYIIYTNITSDHLDYHLCRMHYIFTKLKLRYYLKTEGKILCYEDLPCLQILPLSKLVVLSKRSIVKQDDHGITFVYQQQYYQIPYHTSFQLENAYMVLRLLQQLGFQDLERRMRSLPLIEGRCETFIMKGIQIMIDYAHSSDGLKQLLQNIQVPGKIYCVIGCGGNRDQKKRSKMGEIACQYSDVAIYTADNPRFESIHTIIQMMMNHSYTNYEVFENRYCAIKYAVKSAKKGDIIIIGGKGDERTQEINGVFYPFYDKQCIKEIMKEN